MAVLGVKLKDRWLFAGSGIFSLTCWFSIALSYSPDFYDGLAYASFFGTVACAVIFALCFGVLGMLSLAASYLSSGRVNEKSLAVMSTLLGIAMVVNAAFQARPIAYFRWLVVDPSPVSLKNLDIEKWSGYSDGSAYLLAFDIAPADFDAIVTKRQLRQIDVNWTERTKFLESLGEKPLAEDVNQAFPEDRQLIRWEKYQRPARPSFYSAESYSVVTNPERSRVYMFIDHFRRR